MRRTLELTRTTARYEDLFRLCAVGEGPANGTAKHYLPSRNSSIAAIGTALPGNAFYAATKAEVAILTKRFALELGRHNITVNAVAPGFVRTDMTERGRGAVDWRGTEESFAAKAMMVGLANRRISPTLWPS